MTDEDRFTASAADNWRELQANHILFAFRNEHKQPARTMEELEAWVTSGEYTKPTTEQLQVFRVMLDELRSWRAKYQGLDGKLDPVLEAIDQLLPPPSED